MNDKNSREFTSTIKEMILELELETEIFEIEDEELNENNWESQLRVFARNNIDSIIAIGDTGTFLRAIFLSRNSIPVVSASSERISFFTEITPSTIRENLTLILSQKYLVDTYKRVEIKDRRNRTPLPALNEIAIFPKNSALLMNYTLIVDNNVLYRGRADGLIISTSLGSTGYALSSGGPIAVSDPEILLLVPVNPLNKDHIPVVVPLHADVKLTNLRSRSPIEAIVDGQIRVRIDEDISIKQSSTDVNIIRLQARKNILAKLRNRLVELDLRHLEGAPPAAKYVFKLLVTEGEMTQKELIESTGLPNRTVRNALNILKEKEVISQRAHLRDARQSIYFVS
ncbi:MAG: NAD(+)/NADH kinase [Candidatus Heimdallarchaeota archaeon]|nr:NAD(+)/NADH kinase [Candidatus Heimdallarchaeota archaeon]